MPSIKMKVSLIDLIEMDIDDLNNEFDNKWSNHPKNKDDTTGMSMCYIPIKVKKDSDEILIRVDFEEG